MVEALHADPETADWCREKGDPNGGRELRRIWDKAADYAWLAHCQYNKDGNLRSNLVNTLVALREAPALREMFAYDDMLRAPILMKSLSEEAFTSRPVRDEDVTAVQEWLQRAGLTSVSKDTVHQAVDARARERAFHPVQDYLKALRWDGKPRVATWLHDYVGAKQDAYAEASGPCSSLRWSRGSSSQAARPTTCWSWKVRRARASRQPARYWAGAGSPIVSRTFAAVARMSRSISTASG